MYEVLLPDACQRHLFGHVSAMWPCISEGPREHLGPKRTLPMSNNFKRRMTAEQRVIAACQADSTAYDQHVLLQTLLATVGRRGWNSG